MLLTSQCVGQRYGVTSPRGRVTTTIRIFTSGFLLGSILLNEDNRVLRRTPDVPREVVMKVLVQFTRCGETAGRVTDRDGELYSWRLRGEHES